MTMTLKTKGEASSRGFISHKWTLLLCFGSFCAGLLFTNRMWMEPESSKGFPKTIALEAGKLKLAYQDCDGKSMNSKQDFKDIFGEVFKTHDAIQTLDKTIYNLEMELAAARAAQESILNGSPISEVAKTNEASRKRKYLMVVGINTAFSSWKRRDSVRATWFPQGEKRKILEEEKGIIIRFVIGHSSSSGGILDRAIDAEDTKHGDFLRLVTPLLFFFIIIGCAIPSYEDVLKRERPLEKGKQTPKSSFIGSFLTLFAQGSTNSASQYNLGPDINLLDDRGAILYYYSKLKKKAIKI